MTATRTRTGAGQRRIAIRFRDELAMVSADTRTAKCQSRANKETLHLDTGGTLMIL